MDKFGVLLMAFSVVCFVLSIWQATAPNWNKLISAGLSFLALALFFGNLGVVFK
jgi:hypothetical protein